MFRELKVKCIGFVGICNNISFNNPNIAVEQSLGSYSSLLILVSYTNILVPVEESLSFADKALTSWNIVSLLVFMLRTLTLHAQFRQFSGSTHSSLSR